MNKTSILLVTYVGGKIFNSMVFYSLENVTDDMITVMAICCNKQELAHHATAETYAYRKNADDEIWWMCHRCNAKSSTVAPNIIRDSEFGPVINK